MLTRRLSFAALIAVVLSIQAIASLDASAPDSRMNYLSFNAPTRLPGVGLGAGTYIFELAAPGGDQSIVRVSSRDRSIVYFMGFTELISRPAGMSPDRLRFVRRGVVADANADHGLVPGRRTDGASVYLSEGHSVDRRMGERLIARVDVPRRRWGSRSRSRYRDRLFAF